MERVTRTVNNVTDYMEKDNRGMQITCYSLALFGLTVALRRVRPFSRFRKPSDIPNHFIKEKRQLEGCVKGIHPNGVLIIEHKPLVPLPLIPSGELPVKISGVNVIGFGTNWLQSIVAGQDVTFIPISKEKDYVQCQVLLMQTVRDKKKQTKRALINVGESLIKIGFALPEPIRKPLSEDSTFLKYYALLINAEKYAQRKQMGLKYYIIPTKRILSKSLERLIALFHITKAKVPKMIHKAPKVYGS
ncbi:unnamed protein product [Psylliodes chrysocephalus]|uniref:Uncharacterized protein n=1 Tax=Psylliodes chrysocephalus TaxID=3402493 RepID=A0A9P0DDX2_9CUCU|nr:unnamed protein product [Psylliodes chrysocephala]